MKKLLPLLLTLALTCAPAFAGNLATPYPTIPVSVAGSPINNMTPVLVSIDTINEDLLLFTPDEGNTACIAGGLNIQAAAYSFSLKSTNGPTIPLGFTAAMGLYDKMGSGIIYCAPPGQPIKVRSSVAVPAMLLHVTQSKYYQF